MDLPHCLYLTHLDTFSGHRAIVTSLAPPPRLSGVLPMLMSRYVKFAGKRHGFFGAIWHPACIRVDVSRAVARSLDGVRFAEDR